MSAAPTNLIGLPFAADRIRSGDLLLWRRSDRGLIGKTIAQFGRGIHCHAGMACHVNGKLMVAEVREFHGGRLVSLESQVEKSPRLIDVFHIDHRRFNTTERKVDDAVRYMLGLAGQPYGYGSVLAAALRHLPFIRMLMPFKANGTVRTPHCSAAIALAWQIGAGFDAVPWLPAHLTEPTDLARSLFFQYGFTLAF